MSTLLLLDVIVALSCLILLLEGFTPLLASSLRALHGLKHSYSTMREAAEPSPQHPYICQEAGRRGTSAGVRCAPDNLPETFETIVITHRAPDRIGERGITALILSLLLATLLVSPILAILNSSKEGNRTVARTVHTTLFETRLRRLLDRIVADIDSHPFQILPRIHRNGFITLTDGSENTVHRLRSTTRPLPTSDAISSMRLDMNALLDVTESHDTPGYHTVRACPRFASAYASSKYTGLLAIGVDGLSECIETSSHYDRTSGCYDLVLRPVRSMIVPRIQSDELPSIQRLVPIDALYTLYVDANETLRYLGHRGEENIENQPIIEAAFPFRFTLLNANPSGAFVLSAFREASPPGEIIFSAPHRIPRRPHFAVLWNITPLR